MNSVIAWIKSLLPVGHPGERLRHVSQKADEIRVESAMLCRDLDRIKEAPDPLAALVHSMRNYRLKEDARRCGFGSKS